MGTSWGAVLGAVLLGGAGQVMAAPPAREVLTRELAAIVADPVKPLSGLSVLAMRGGEVVYEGQFGRARIATNGAGADMPVTPRTMFRIASVSKMMTTLALMQLVERGDVSLDADASRYLGFTLRNPHFPDRVITLRQLLTHTSSLRDDAGYSFGAGTALQDVLAREPKAWAADRAPGGYFTYCNLGWGVIGTVMERVTGERFDRLMRQLLLAPLGLRGGYNPAAFSPEELADTATLYRRRTTDTEVWNSAGPWIAQVDDYGVRPPVAPAGIDRYVVGTNATLFSPTGGLRISARDLGTVMRMLVDGGRHGGRQLLRPETLAQMFSAQWTYRDPASGDTLNGLYHSWGLGTQRFPDLAGRGNRLVDGAHFEAVGHLGEAYGLVATFAVDLARGDGMVSLIGGFGSDPERDPGSYSALTRAEERILTTLYRGAIAPQPHDPRL